MSRRKENFATRREAVWQQISDEVGGVFANPEGWRQDKIRVRVGEWAVLLDFHSLPGYKAEKIYTRLRAPYFNHDHFKFGISHEGLLGKVAHLLGAQDVTTGFDDFDRMFMVKANDEQRIKQLFANEHLRDLIKTEPYIHIHVRPCGDWMEEDFPNDIDELVLEVEGRVADHDRLKRLFDIFAETLTTLCHIGPAYESDA